MTPEQVPTERAGQVRRLLVALVSAVCRFPRLVLAASLLLCGLSAYAAATRLEYHTQRDDLISARKDYQVRWQRYLQEFGADDDIVAVIKGDDRGRMCRALEALAGRLAGHPDLFDRLFYKVDLRHIRNRALLFLPAEQIRSIQADYLADMRRLLDSGPVGWHALGVLTMTQEAKARAGAVKPGAALSPSDEKFFAQYAGVVRAARDTLADPSAYKAPWGNMLSAPQGQASEQASRGAAAESGQKDLLAEPQYFFSGDGTLAFLLVRPVKEAGSFTAALKGVSTARGIVKEVSQEFPELEMGLTGMPVLETDEMVAAEHDTRLASWLALGGVAGLFLLVYRSVYYPALTVTTLLVGTTWAMGWLTLTVGHLNILSATFAVMLIGMGDYGVLWVMRYEEARRLGLDVRGALLHTTIHVAISNLTAASTLALAFFAALFADFKAVAELGWIAGCGVLLCAFACFTVLPALLMTFDRRGQLASPAIKLFDGGEDKPADTWLPWLRGRAGLVLGCGLVVALALGACATKVSYDHNLLHLQAQGLDSVKWEMTLIEHTAGASWHALSITDTPEEAVALAARYKELPEVSSVVEVGSLLPHGQEEKLPHVRAIHSALEKLPARRTSLTHPATDIPQLRAEVATLIDRVAPLASCAVLADLCRGLRELATRLTLMSPETASDRLRAFDQKLAEDLAENLHQLREVSTPAPITLRDLPEPLRERYVGSGGKWLLRVFARDSLWDFGPLEEFTHRIRAVDAEATGKPFGTVEGLKAMKNGLIRAGLYAFGVIVLVLWLDFRRLRDTVIALTPLVLGVLLSLGVMGLLGYPLNPANMIAFPLILGVGVDNGVHVLHDWLIRQRQGKDGVSRAIGRGVLVKALTTMIGFGTLMIATERGLVGLGFILTLGVGCSMLSALVLLPAALVLLGRRAEEAPVAGALPAAGATEPVVLRKAG